MKNELHPIQQQLLEKFGLKHQINKLREEMKELEFEIRLVIDYEHSIRNACFYSEFLDVRNLMQQIESKLDPQLLEKYEQEMFEKAKSKYLDK